MRYKKYKVGDRIFYKCWDGSIETDIVIKVQDEVYEVGSGWDKLTPFHYQWLTLWEEGNCSTGIENYNCLPQNSPEYKEFAKKYAKFDRQKDNIINSIMKILSPWDKSIQQDILKLLEIKIK